MRDASLLTRSHVRLLLSQAKDAGVLKDDIVLAVSPPGCDQDRSSAPCPPLPRVLLLTASGSIPSRQIDGVACPAGSAAQMWTDGAAAAAAAPPTIHPGVCCDESGMVPIVGTRYTLTGKDYDLCQVHTKAARRSQGGVRPT